MNDEYTVLNQQGYPGKGGPSGLKGDTVSCVCVCVCVFYTSNTEFPSRSPTCCTIETDECVIDSSPVCLQGGGGATGHKGLARH